MARPKKQGLDYFPFDVDFFADEKIAAISGEFGIKGEITAIKLLCAIYRNGYFILWSEPLKYKLLRDLPGVGPELFDQIVNRLVKWGFFDETLFNSVKVLTSRGIQKRYFSIARRRGLSQKEDYILVSDDNNPVATELLTTKTPQRKGNKSKLNNTPLSPFEGKTNHDLPIEFCNLWENFRGKRKSIEEDFNDFQNKTDGLIIDYVKLRYEAQFAKDICFQSWLNRFFPKATRRKELDLSFVEPTFQPIMADWLAYKSERGQTYRQLGLRRCYTRLLSLSDNDANKARKIVDVAIANNYAGLFPLQDRDTVSRSLRHPATNYHVDAGQKYEEF